PKLRKNRKSPRLLALAVPLPASALCERHRKSHRPVKKNILLHNQQQSKPCLKHSRPQRLPSFELREVPRSPHTPHPHRKQPLVACTRLFKSPSPAKLLRCN